MSMDDPQATPVRLLLADDQKLMRQALRVFVENEPGMEVVGEAQDGRSAVIQAKTLHPDVVLMDLQMPRLDGVAATEEVLAACPNTKVVAVTTFHSEEYVIPALRAVRVHTCSRIPSPKTSSPESVPPLPENSWRPLA